MNCELFHLGTRASSKLQVANVGLTKCVQVNIFIDLFHLFIYLLESYGVSWRNISSAECKKVVSDIFGKIEFLMEYENIGLYAHFALFSRFLALLLSKILSKMCSKSATYDPIALIFDKCV